MEPTGRLLAGVDAFCQLVACQSLHAPCSTPVSGMQLRGDPSGTTDASAAFDSDVSVIPYAQGLLPADTEKPRRTDPGHMLWPKLRHRPVDCASPTVQ